MHEQDKESSFAYREAWCWTFQKAAFAANDYAKRKEYLSKADAMSAALICERPTSRPILLRRAMVAKIFGELEYNHGKLAEKDKKPAQGYYVEVKNTSRSSATSAAGLPLSEDDRGDALAAGLLGWVRYRSAARRDRPVDRHAGYRVSGTVVHPHAKRCDRRRAGGPGLGLPVYQHHPGRHGGSTGSDLLQPAETAPSAMINPNPILRIGCLLSAACENPGRAPPAPRPRTCPCDASSCPIPPEFPG